MTFLEEKLLLVFLITSLLLPLIFGNHFHKEPSCNCCVSNETSATSEDDAEVDDDKKNSYKLLQKKKKARKPCAVKKFWCALHKGDTSKRCWSDHRPIKRRTGDSLYTGDEVGSQHLTSLEEDRCEK